MVRYRLKELLADREFREGRVITFMEVAKATGIHRVTLSKIANARGYATNTDVLERLCRYFACTLDQLVEFIPD